MFIISLFQRAYFRNCSHKMTFIFYFGTNKERVKEISNSSCNVIMVSLYKQGYVVTHSNQSVEGKFSKFFQLEHCQNISKSSKAKTESDSRHRTKSGLMVFCTLQAKAIVLASALYFSSVYALLPSVPPAQAQPSVSPHVHFNRKHRGGGVLLYLCLT